jgi:small subunit ribosomal protein S9
MTTTTDKKRYFEAVGRRKTSVARVRMLPAAKNSFTINDKDIQTYFSTEEMRGIVQEAVLKNELTENFSVSVHVNGGGIHSQAEAIRHGIARALVLFDAPLRKNLKKAGFLKRDPRAKERRKFGLKKARKAPQWSKR